jgi:glycine cleavage system H protein
MNSKRDDPTPLLPVDALPCVWMTAGLVAYHLCDRGFDCDDCPLDLALRGVAGPADAQVADIPGTSWEFRPDRRYHRGHMWLSSLDAPRLRCGIDVFAARLLDRVTSVVFPTVHSRLDRGHPACWVTDEGTLIPLQSPVAGTVVGVNGKVQQDPSLMSQSPYDEGWETDRDSNGDLISAERMRQQTERELKRLHGEMRRHLREDQGVGHTLADGGEPVTDLRRILGVKRYHRLVQRILG